MPDESDEGVEIPSILCPVSTEDLQYLRQLYSDDLIIASDSHAVDVYIHVRDYVYSHQHQSLAF